MSQDSHYGCVRLASPGRPRCMACFFFQNERMQIITHVCPGKKNATHRGRPREAFRLATMFIWCSLFNDAQNLILYNILGWKDQTCSSLSIHSMASYWPTPRSHQSGRFCRSGEGVQPQERWSHGRSLQVGIFYWLHFICLSLAGKSVCNKPQGKLIGRAATFLLESSVGS